MSITGKCYCGDIEFEANGEPFMRGQCHCRECQYLSGGGVNLVLALPEDSFTYTKGSPASFTRDDIEGPVTREFCGRCGTHIVSKAPGLAGAVMIKVGVLDDPSIFGKPDMAIFTCDAQSFHHIPEGIPTFETVPG